MNRQPATYILREDTLLHRPTGLRVELPPAADHGAAIRQAKLRLMKKIEAFKNHKETT